MTESDLDWPKPLETGPASGEHRPMMLVDDPALLIRIDPWTGERQTQGFAVGQARGRTI